jgi:hypothetical protein
MSAEHLPAIAAIHADDIIALNGLPSRHYRLSLIWGFHSRFPEAGECLMDGRNQRTELIGRNLIAPNIRGNYFRCKLLTILLGWLLIGHLFFLSVGAPVYHPDQF